jgi:predicted MPP superfamily phosphohydrolase
MSKFSWLHLSDLHCGMRGQKHLWPNIQEKFFEDLQKLHDVCGPWDVVLFTGDLVQRGASGEFDNLNEVLAQVWDHLNKLGSYPFLLPIPSNHDLSRPDIKSPAVRLLSKWRDNSDIHEEFWEDANSDYRKVIDDAFSNYVDWWSRCRFSEALTVQRGLLPGDFSSTIVKDDLSIGVVGLNTTFLQLTEGNYFERLAVDIRQLHEACNGDGAKWVKQHNVNILMTHQPPIWLSEQVQRKDYAEIAPAGRFAVHLFGHMHEHLIKSESIGGGPVHRVWQGSSLFGLETFGEDKKESRRHGYSTGQIEIKGGEGYLRMWPRIARFHNKNGWQITADVDNFILEDDDGVRAEKIELRSVPTSVKPSRLQSNDLALLNKSTITKTIKSTSNVSSEVRLGRWPRPFDDLALKDYCEALISCHGFIRFVEIPFLKDTSDVELDNLYVIPRFSTQEIHADTSPTLWPKCIDAIAALKK